MLVGNKFFFGKDLQNLRKNADFFFSGYGDILFCEMEF